VLKTAHAQETFLIVLEHPGGHAKQFGQETRLYRATGEPVALFSHSCYTVVTLLLHCCYTAVTLASQSCGCSCACMCACIVPVSVCARYVHRALYLSTIRRSWTNTGGSVMESMGGATWHRCNIPPRVRVCLCV
jgi:hypothetical protein